VQVTDYPAVIIAPHPDDEILACGGLIALKRAMGVPVLIIFLTNGENSLSGWTDEKPLKVAEVRRNQAACAAACVGVPRDALRWVGLPDGAIPLPGTDAFDAAAVKLRAEINSTAYEIFCPHRCDSLADHEAAAELTLAAVGPAVTVQQYIIWGWYNGYRHMLRFPVAGSPWRLDIRRVVYKKVKAMREYLQPMAVSGIPFTGKLPPSLIANAHRHDELFFRRIRADT
jgi:LmbE family N-acetylglucosaminyl deacetylase